MNLTVFGATGRTGALLVNQALDRGHKVTAVIRTGARLSGDLADLVEVVAADIFDPAAIADAVAGREAVLSVIAARDRNRPTSVGADSTTAIAEALRSTDTDARLVIASNSALAPGPGDDPFTRYFVKPVILSRVLRHANADARRAEQITRTSGLPWTIMRPGMLSDRPAKGAYRSAVDRNVTGGFQITRADLATAMLDATENPDRAGHIVSVAN
jgi:putative NADH-flavin reductase